MIIFIITIVANDFQDVFKEYFMLVFKILNI